MPLPYLFPISIRKIERKLLYTLQVNFFVKATITFHRTPSLPFTFFVIPKSKMLLRRFRLADFGVDVDVEVALDGGIKEEGWDWDSTGVP